MAKFVVTGTPRSATGYAAALFQELGIPCAHEKVFRPRACLHEVLEWHARDGDQAESSWLAWVFLRLLPGSDRLRMLHTVREPWKVVESLANQNDIVPEEAEVSSGKREYREITEWYCPRMQEYDSAMNRAAVMVIDWNRLIERRAKRFEIPYRRYRVESLTAESLNELLGWLGIYRDVVEAGRALDSTPRNVNRGQQIEYNIEVKNPLVRGYLQEINPDMPPVLPRVLSKSAYRSREEIESELAPELRSSLAALAERYGYPLVNTGVQDHESCDKCQVK